MRQVNHVTALPLDKAPLNQAAVREDIRQNAAFTKPFVVMNALATVVACYGLLADSTAVVIGAMIIAMLLGPIAGIALALVDGDSSLLRTALLAEAGGAALVLAVSFTLGCVHRDLPLTHELLARTHPNLLDLMIALAGGAAGAYATVSPRLSVGLVGVAIATALVPPLSTCGICLARGASDLAWGGFVLFFTNLVAIQFASSVVMWLHGFHAVTRTGENGENQGKTRSHLLLTNGVSFAVLTLLTVTMGISFTRSISTQRFESETRARLETALQAYPGANLADLRFGHDGAREKVTAVVRTPFSFSPARVRAMEAFLPHPAGRRVDLTVRSVIVKEATRNGYLHETEGEPGPPETTDAPVFGR
jgi:uncharacterized hydrophobic protein (TIGR00271 family)